MRERVLAERALARFVHREELHAPGVRGQRAQLLRRGREEHLPGFLVEGQVLHAPALDAPAAELEAVQRVHRFRRLAVGLEKPFPPPRSAPDIENRHAAHAEDEGGDFLRLAQLSRAQALERHEEHLLHEVVRRVRVAQVPQAVEAHARREPLVFHTGARGLFPLVSEAIAKVVPLASIRYVAFSHFEADEKPQTLACMHGSAWRGDGAGLLRALAKSLETQALALPLAA